MSPEPTRWLMICTSVEESGGQALSVPGAPHYLSQARVPHTAVGGRSGSQEQVLQEKWESSQVWNSPSRPQALMKDKHLTHNTLSFWL